MGFVRVIFSRRSNPGSLLIRTVLWSAWSHCGIVDGDQVIEAAMFHGVRERSLDDFKKDASKWEIIEIPVRDSSAIIAAARSRIGEPYDWLGVLALLVHIDLQRPMMDFCSKLVAWAFATAGEPLFRVEVWRITPRDLYIRYYEPLPLAA
jgi:uncharacterized protein YycO